MAEQRQDNRGREEPRREMQREREPAPAAVRGQESAQAPRSAFNPGKDPVAYLEGKGWRSLGNPSWESCLWLDPTKPLTASYTTQKCEYEEIVYQTINHRDGRREVQSHVETKQVIAQGAAGIANVPAVRPVFNPAVTPLPTQEAVMIQIQRDLADEARAESERAKAEAERVKKAG